MLKFKNRITNDLGIYIDLNSMKEISILIKNLGLQELLDWKALTQSLLEQIASRQPLLKLVVKYKRTEKQLRRVESIIKSIHNGRIYPLFNQTKNHTGHVSSTDPDLFADDGLVGLSDCVDGELPEWFQNARKSVDCVQQASGDLSLIMIGKGQKRPIFS